MIIKINDNLKRSKTIFGIIYMVDSCPTWAQYKSLEMAGNIYNSIVLYPHHYTYKSMSILFTILDIEFKHRLF